MQSFFSHLTIELYFIWGLCVIAFTLIALMIGEKFGKFGVWFLKKSLFFFVAPISLVVAIGNAIPLILYMASSKKYIYEPLIKINAFRSDYGGILFLLGLFILWLYFVEMARDSSLSSEYASIMGLQVIGLLFILDYLQNLMGNLDLLKKSSNLKLVVLLALFLALLFFGALLSKKIKNIFVARNEEIIANNIFVYAAFIGLLEPSVLIASSLLFFTQRILHFSWPEGMNRFKRKNIFDQSFSRSISLIASFLGYLVLLRVFMLPFLNLELNMAFELGLFFLSIIVLTLYTFDFSPLIVSMIGIPCSAYFIILLPLKKEIIKISYINLVNSLSGARITDLAFSGLPVFTLFIAPILLHLFIIIDILFSRKNTSGLISLFSSIVTISLWPHAYFVLASMSFGHISYYRIFATLVSIIMIGSIVYVQFKIKRKTEI